MSETDRYGRVFTLAEAVLWDHADHVIRRERDIAEEGSSLFDIVLPLVDETDDWPMEARDISDVCTEVIAHHGHEVWEYLLDSHELKD